MNTNKQLTKGKKMKKVIMMIGLISVIGLNLNTAANALVLVDGYFKSNGTYVTLTTEQVLMEFAGITSAVANRHL